MKVQKRRSDRAGRAPLPSPGRPSVAGRDKRQRFWAAIAEGLVSEDAALKANVPPAVGVRWFRTAGGIRPAMFGPSAKPLSGRYLSFTEREEIALLRVRGYSMQEIARRLGRAASTISRELRRNAATRSGGLEYRATTAQWHAERSARRPKTGKLAVNAALRAYVEERLAGTVVAPGGAVVLGPVVSWKGRRHGRRQARRWSNAWSPEQIARRLPIDFPDDETMRISHEAIYQALFVQGRGALRRELTACLRSGRPLRIPRARTRSRGKAFISPEIMIRQRPPEAADRAVPGHWEGDLILGLGSSAIGTLVERATRFTLLLHLPRLPGYGHNPRGKNGPALAGHGADAVCSAITRTIIRLPEQLRRSLTWDQGAEMAQHARLKIDTGVQVYFCDPQSPWQRGTNENTNGLLRQYFPKGTDLSTHSAEQIAAVAVALNSRPRKALGWKTPAEALDALLLSAEKNRVAMATPLEALREILPPLATFQSNPTQNTGNAGFGAPEKLTVEQVRWALIKTKYNITRTAGLLGVARCTIYEYTERYPELGPELKAEVIAMMCDRARDVVYKAVDVKEDVRTSVHVLATHEAGGNRSRILSILGRCSMRCKVPS